MAEGDLIEVVDGKGNSYVCRLVDSNPKGASVEIVSCTPTPLPWHQTITIAVAPTKNMDRMEWMVEKLTEIGINRFVTLLCRRSERKAIKTERLEKIAVSAMKQSLKAVCPEILQLTSLSDFLRNDAADEKYICYCDDSVERHLLAKEYRHGNVSILIGPEGDFSPEEVDDAIKKGYKPVSLGDTRLRTETAAIVAAETCHVINLLNQ